MNSMQKLVKEIRNILESNDWSNTPQRQEMAEQFAEYCRNYQDLVFKCSDLIEQNMLAEAVDLANNQEPPLFQQLKLLDFPDAGSFRELGLIYEWTAIPELDHEVLEKLKSMDRDSKNLQPLLNAYRQVVRSDDVKTKVMLLRRLVQVDSNSKEWKSALVQQEQIWQAALIRQTKDAIIEQKYDLLESLFEKITDPEWTEKAPEKVISKIMDVLEKHRLEELKKKAVKTLEAINEAYSNFDYDGLTKALAEWQDLISRFGYQPENQEALQVKEAREYWLQQKKQRAEDARFEELSEQLKSKLEKKAPQDELDMIYDQILLMDRRPAEHIEQQYLAVKDTYETTLRRKRILKTASITAGILAVIGLTVFLIYMQIMSSTERKWVQQISAALEEKTSASALTLIRELQKERPDFAKRPRIARLITQANKRLEQEEFNRKQFAKQTGLFRGLLKDFEKNQQKLIDGLKELKRNIVDNREKEVFNQLNTEFITQRDLFHTRKKDVFERFITRINISRGKFYEALEKVKLDSAAKIIAEIRELEKQASESYGVIRTVFPGREPEFSQSRALQEKLFAISGKVRKGTDLMNNIRTPNSLTRLHDDIQEFLKVSVNAADTANMKNLLASAIHAQDMMDSLQGKTPSAENHFSLDIAKKNAIGKKQQTAREKSSEFFEKINSRFEKNPFYALIFKTQDNLILDLYFKKQKFNFTTLNDKLTCKKLGYMKDESGGIGYAEISGNSGSGVVTVDLNGEKYNCNMIYPDQWNKAAITKLAPHILAVRKINDMLQCEPTRIEENLIKAVTFLIDSQELNPFLSLNFIKLVERFMLIADPENPSYVKLKKDMDSFSVPKKYNWLESYSAGNVKRQKDLRLHLAIVSSNMKLVSHQGFFLRLWNIMLSRKLVPAGFISADGAFHRFSSAPENGELWLIPADHTSRIRVLGTYRNDKMQLNNKANPAESAYSVLFTPSDSRDTKKIVSEFTDSSDYAVFSAQDYPCSWPTF